MLRLLVILIPPFVAVGCALLALKLPPRGDGHDHPRRIIAGAFAIGVFFSAIIWWQQTTVADQIQQVQRAAASQKAETDLDKAEEAGYKEKIQTLTAQVTSLQAQLAKQGDNAQPAVIASATKQQNSALPKIYWAQESGGAGTTAVRFKVYGPLNIAAFVATCDHPCRATSGQIGTGSEGIQVVGPTSKIAGYVFRKPRPIAAGSEGFIILEPGSARVTDFRILGESEIPANLK